MATHDDTYRGRLTRLALEAEERRRPVTAEVTVADGTAVLRLLDRRGRVPERAYQITLGPFPYLHGPVLTAAGDAIAEAGFRLDGGWTEDRWEQDITATPIDVTPEYLEYVARRYGPPPELGTLPPQMSARRRGRAEWRVAYQQRRAFTLRWGPRLHGPEWRLTSDAEESRGTSEYDTASEALAAAVEIVRLCDARRARHTRRAPRRR